MIVEVQKAFRPGRGFGMLYRSATYVLRHRVTYDLVGGLPEPEVCHHRRYCVLAQLVSKSKLEFKAERHYVIETR